MADVVCWVRDEGDQLRVTWSSGPATFPPYFLAKSTAPRPDAIEEALATLLRENAPPAALELARVGHGLYRYLFAADADQPTVHSVRQWWEAQRDQATSLEVVGFSPYSGLWHLTYDRAPNDHAFLHDMSNGECWRPFWGMRYSLGDGRRVNPLAGQRTLRDPRMLLAADHYLPEEERRRLAAFVEAQQLPFVATGEPLETAVKDLAPDVLLVLRHAGGSLIRTEVSFHAGLAGEINPQPTESPPGLVGNRVCARQAMPAGVAGSFGIDFLEGFLTRGESAGEALRRARLKHAPFGLAYASSVPPGLRVRRGTDTTPPPVPTAEDELPPLPDLPYRNLRPCGADDRALFTGRDEETLRLAHAVDEGRAGLVLLHGPSGTGKTSLLQAGLLPFLEEDCPGFWPLRDETGEEGSDDALVIRCTSDPAGQLARALVHFCARPIAYETPAGQTVTWDGPALLDKQLRTTEPGDRILELRDSLQEDPALLGRILCSLAEALPWQLLVAIDQGEDLLASDGEEGPPDLADLEMFRHAAAAARNYTVIFALRTDAFGPVADALGLGEKSRVASFYLPELDEERLVQTILWPTATEPVAHTAEVPNEVYDFLFEEGLAEHIAREALRKTRGQGETLPLIQTLCGRLYRRLAGRADRVIRANDLKKLGGVGPALGKYLSEIVARDLHRGERRAVRELLNRLCGRRADGTRFSRPGRWNELEGAWSNVVARGGGRPFADAVRLLTDEDTRLLRAETLADDGKEREYVGVAHDAIGEAVEETAEQGRTRKYGRARVADTLWIMIPLTVLVASLVYTLTTRAFSPIREDVTELTKSKAALTRMVDLQRYQATLGQAEQAIRSGNSLRAHQLLKESLSAYQRGPEIVAPLDDLRGFEWHYLWNQVHPERRTIQGFVGTFPCVAVSGDGKTLAVGGDSPGTADEKDIGTVKLYELGSGEFRQELRGHKGAVLAVALSHDGQAVASAGEDGTVRLWTLKEKSASSVELRGHEGSVRALAFSPYGHTLASGGDDGKVILWDLAGKKRAVLAEHTGAVEALAFPPASRRLNSSKDQLVASASADKTVILWEEVSGKKRSVLKGHTGAVHALAFSQDGLTLASGGVRPEDRLNRGAVRLWDVEKGTERPGPAPPDVPEVFALAYGRDDKTLFIGGKDNRVRLWGGVAREENDHWHGHFGWVRHLAVSPDGKTLVTASYDHTVKVWDTQPPPARLRGDGAPVQAVAFAGDGNTFASADRDGNTYLWDVRGDRPLQTLRQPKMSVAGVVLSRKGKLVVTAAWDAAKDESTLALWSAADGKALKTLPAQKGAITCLAVSPDGKTLASGGTDRRVQLWRLDEDTSALEERRTLVAHTAAVRCVAFSRDGQWLASGGDDKAVWLWDPNTGKKKHEARRHHTGPVTALAFTRGEPKRVMLASTGADRTVWIFWVPEEPQMTWTWRGFAGVPLALAYSGDGQTLAVAGADRCVTLWDAERDEPRLTLTGHTQPITCLAFAPDGRTLVSGGLDGDLRVWRAAPK